MIKFIEILASTCVLVFGIVAIFAMISFCTMPVYDGSVVEIMPVSAIVEHNGTLYMMKGNF
jgi:hypothetical protein